MKNKIFGRLENISPMNETVNREDIYNVIDWIIIEDDIEVK